MPRPIAGPQPQPPPHPPPCQPPPCQPPPCQPPPPPCQWPPPPPQWPPPCPPPQCRPAEAVVEAAANPMVSAAMLAINLLLRVMPKLLSLGASREFVRRSAFLAEPPLPGVN